MTAAERDGVRSGGGDGDGEEREDNEPARGRRRFGLGMGERGSGDEGRDGVVEDCEGQPQCLRQRPAAG